MVGIVPRTGVKKTVLSATGIDDAHRGDHGGVEHAGHDGPRLGGVDVHVRADGVAGGHEPARVGGRIEVPLLSNGIIIGKDRGHNSQELGHSQQLDPVVYLNAFNSRIPAENLDSLLFVPSRRKVEFLQTGPIQAATFASQNAPPGPLPFPF